ncbi:RAMP superfamily CRISPR-associated protein [Ornithinimicrobium avium]|uniref:CRISPR type III-associated protein domain-containing protein n=1 Tax=Ornithinimicrobium avium TaxID=2283195 RepID=A0A345NLQ3_9MICO|nr:RAMP superfamily CRISPR-associated protein [Ornithinimicrobium avium]AXH95961.1 hypothetical protein DV701_07345 [Ornithinimicrobium avium]
MTDLEQAAPLDALTLFTLRLRLVTSTAVATPKLPSAAPDADEPDSVPVMDADGHPILPGTSLAGSFHRHLARRVDADQLTKLLGRGGTDAVAGTLHIYDATLTGPHRWLDEHSTAIDRHTAAAKESTKRHVRRVARGAEFITHWRLDNPTGTDEQAVVQALSTWAPLLGQSVTNGHGDVIFLSVTHGSLDLTEDDDLLTYLTLHGPALHEQVATHPVDSPEPTTRERFTLPLRIVEPLHAGTGQADRGTTDAPKVNRVARDGGQFVLRGSSVRGVLRSRIDYLLHSLDLAECPEQRCGTCLTCKIFGFTNAEAARRGSVRFLDVIVTGAPPEPDQIQHVALDRFTGGARDTALFTDEVVPTGDIDVVVEDLDSSSQQWRQLGALLRLVAADIDDGFVRLGGGGSRGYGRMQLRAEDLPTSGLPQLKDAQALISGMIPAEGEGA